jgi:trimethylamine-N-oxide reductase (cytochrome c)
MLSNPDSWEGWYWGAEHVWGSPSRFWSFGLMEQSDLLEDVMQNSKLIISWSVDPESQNWFNGQDTAIWRLWLKELGIRQISISPDLNYDAGLYADLWIPILPGTDSALASAIAYIWINEGTYMKEYVYSHGYGFAEWKDYLLGKHDKIPKTPEWAEKITGVKARIIKALARDWASNPTALCIRMGSACRVPYGTEWARMMILLQTMQGIGRPGVSIWDPGQGAPVDNKTHPPPSKIESITSKTVKNPINQMIWRTRIADAILNPPIRWHSFGVQAGFGGLPVEQQFEGHRYPLNGHSEIRLIYRQGSAHFSTWCNTNNLVEAYQSPKIEFIVTQDLWMGGEAPFSDVLLPANSVFERNDLVPLSSGSRNYTGAVYMKKCIEPLWDSRSDFDIIVMLARKLGVEHEYTEGNTEEECIKKLFVNSSLPQYISYDDFKRMGYFIFPFPEDWLRIFGIRRYYKSKGEGLETPSGKIEFFSQRLHKHYPNDEEKPAVPKHIESEESLSSERAIKFPLLMESPHPRYRFHTQHAENPWLKEIPGNKFFKEGYYYEIIWMNSKDAKPRRVENGDLVKVFNERGATICAVQITERIMPGVVRVPDGSWYDPLEPGKPGSIDRGGAVNLLTPDRPITKDAEGMVINAFLVEVEKWRI